MANKKNVADNANLEPEAMKSEPTADVQEEKSVDYNELVEVELFKDNGKYKDDVLVAVNGVGILIPRGEKVKVKRKYALALENSMKQDKSTAKFIGMKVRECQEAESKL